MSTLKGEGGRLFLGDKQISEVKSFEIDLGAPCPISMKVGFTINFDSVEQYEKAKHAMLISKDVSISIVNGVVGVKVS